jgi:hypothetical protein
MTTNSSAFDRFRDPNPYDVLGVSDHPSAAEIATAFAAAMRRRQYPVDVIARSRKRLLDPQGRLLAGYLRIEFLEIDPLPILSDGPEEAELSRPSCPEHLDGLADLLSANDLGILGYEQLLGRQLFEP